MLTISRYGELGASRWNAFVASARNGVFLHDRRYMDYHAERFIDCSLIVNDGGATLALLPAHRLGNQLVSHGGLSFGGLICAEAMTLGRCMEAFEAIADFCRGLEIDEILYRPVPRQFHHGPTEEDLAALHSAGAEIVRRHLCSVIDREFLIRPRKGRRHAATKAAKADVSVAASMDWAGFWRVLENNLTARHDAKPVHSLAEITLLAARFPDNIKLFVAQRNGEIIAGTVIYETPVVARTQYIAGSPDGLELGALDLLFHVLITDVYQGKRYFDFGTSLDGEGALNRGLLEQKEGFGARAMIQDHYRLAL
jgi:hypothetical protein